jgi:cytochrome c oxidase subunit 2
MLQKLLGLPINASERGADMDRLILYIHILMVVLFVGWITFFLYTLFRFRKGRNPRADYTGVKTHASSYLEVAIAAIEVVLLVGISIPFWSWKVSAFPTEPNAVHVRVIAQQFAWNIHYPGPDGIFGRTDIKLVNEESNPIGLDRKGDPHAKDDIVTLNQLHLPVNRPAVIDITTKDVIHSFFLPVMRVKQDAIPGMLIPIHFTPTRTSDEMREELAFTLTLGRLQGCRWHDPGEKGTPYQQRCGGQVGGQRYHHGPHRAALPGGDCLRPALWTEPLSHAGLSHN